MPSLPDGSCFDNSSRVAKAEGHGFNKIRYAPPSYLDQSAVVAEIVALLVATMHAAAGVTDCATVYYGFTSLAKAAR